MELLMAANSFANLAGTGAVTYHSLKIVGTAMPGGTLTRTLTLSRGIFMQELTHPFKIGADWSFPFQFAALAATATPVFTLTDSGSLD
jgi:hypothetical protein